VTGEPFAAADDQESVTVLLPATAEFSVGAPGGPAGVAAREFEAGPFPLAFVATTVNEYVVPFVSPLTVQPSPAVVQVKPPGEDVAV
jgi:hypothetical protein